MLYSLAVLQPKAARFFADVSLREDFLRTLAHGNRWPVTALITALTVTAATVVGTAPGPVAAGFAVTLVLDLVAAAVFYHVSWRHWPARVFALPDELPGYQRRLRMLAWTMLSLAGAGFLVALAAGVPVAAGAR